MATAEGLMNLGTPAEQAKRTGVSIVSVTAVGTGATTGPRLVGPGNLVVLLTTSGGNSAFNLPANADIGDTVEVYSLSTTAPTCFPQAGGTINGGAPDASLALSAGAATTANAAAFFRKVTALNWRSNTDA